METDQPPVVSRTAAQPADAAGVREVRSNVPDRFVRRSRARVSRQRYFPRGRGASLRPLQHRHRSVQICRRLGAGAISEKSSSTVRLKADTTYVARRTVYTRY